LFPLLQLLSCGDDSVVKLWTIKTSECVATFSDAHDGKIWAMTRTPDGKMVITGGSDSVLNVWKDVSAEDIEEAEAERETFLLQEQELTNLIRQKRYKQAVGKCLQLEQPRKAYTIVQELMVTENKSPDLPSQLPDIVGSLSDEMLTRLVGYIRDWNTHAKTSAVAQMLLSHIFRALPPARLLANRSVLHQSTNLTLYSERHFARLDKLLTKSYLMDHMLNAMKAVEPDQTIQEKERKGVESNSVLQRLLESTSAPGASSLFTKPSTAAAVPGAPTSNGHPDDAMEDGDGFDADDDGAAWATNWSDTPAVTESKEDDDEEMTPAAAAAPTKKTAGKRKEQPEQTPAEPAAALTKKQKKAANKAAAATSTKKK
jgi:U3 small nucleolar RNA-associated protein 13